MFDFLKRLKVYKCRFINGTNNMFSSSVQSVSMTRMLQDFSFPFFIPAGSERNDQSEQERRWLSFLSVIRSEF